MRRLATGSEELDPHFAGWRNWLTHQAHNLKTVGSKPTPALHYKNTTRMVPFVSHVKELQARGLYIILSFGLCLGISFLDSSCLIFVLLKPLWKLTQTNFIFTHTLEALHASIFAHIMVSFLLCLPVGVYHLWAFISPSLYVYEKTLLTKVCQLSLGVYVLGILGFYFILFPLGCQFFLSFQSSILLLEPRVLEYLHFFVQFLIVFLGVCILPFGIFWICKTLKIQPQELQKKRSLGIVGTLLLGAFLAPPDILTQSIIAGFLFIWYEILILSLWIQKNNT